MEHRRLMNRDFVVGRAIGVPVGLLVAGSSVLAQFGAAPRPVEPIMPQGVCYTLGTALSCIPTPKL